MSEQDEYTGSGERTVLSALNTWELHVAVGVRRTQHDKWVRFGNRLDQKDRRISYQDQNKSKLETGRFTKIQCCVE